MSRDEISKAFSEALDKAMAQALILAFRQLREDGFSIPDELCEEREAE